MTWDQIWTWLIWPGFVTLVVAVGGLWYSRHIP